MRTIERELVPDKAALEIFMGKFMSIFHASLWEGLPRLSHKANEQPIKPSPKAKRSSYS